MEITTRRENTELTVSLSGELNTLTAPDLDARTQAELPGITSLVLDFSECDYVSSAGIRVLLALYKQMKKSGGSMRLINVGEMFAEVLENVGLDAVFGLI